MPRDEFAIDVVIAAEFDALISRIFDNCESCIICRLEIESLQVGSLFNLCYTVGPKLSLLDKEMFFVFILVEVTFS